MTACIVFILLWCMWATQSHLARAALNQINKKAIQRCRKKPLKSCMQVWIEVILVPCTLCGSWQVNWWKLLLWKLRMFLVKWSLGGGWVWIKIVHKIYSINHVFKNMEAEVSYLFYNSPAVGQDIMLFLIAFLFSDYNAEWLEKSGEMLWVKSVKGFSSCKEWV